MREFLKNWSPKIETAPAVRQAGALPYAVVQGRVAFLLITSRRSGKWIFPKGAIETDMTPWDSAALEALEEAGVVGVVSQTSVGSYRASANADGSGLMDVDLYPLEVRQQLDDYKEKGQRMRHWATLPEARRLLVDPMLGRLATRLHGSLTTGQFVRSLSGPDRS
jgi:8-oxo-dGTP pyrophosphatase MutT (NUDIX family)